MKFSNTKVLSIFLFCSILLVQQSCKNSTKTTPEGTGESKDTTDKFADNIRRTPFQTPEEERKGFKLPPGFEISLFASEPDINKPINMKFDARGRLWVTTTVEYPMPATGRKGRDKIVILEDTDGDGKADKFTPFVDTLDIPIGIALVNKGAIAYSIPNIYKFTDTNGDDRADISKKLLGPFEHVDTHGMVNNLLRGFDGWIYACHGYANRSTVAGSDGDSITMASGNSFRFKEDGSHVEIVAHGRVNPFGYAYDNWGFLYSLDCETRPIYQMVPGAQYPTQGVTEPSIGWAPAMMSYEFGATANSGLVYYTGTQFPDSFKHNFFSGNVVTCRINRNTMTMNGSTPEAHREPDFLVSEDPWFRPVDVKTGPDGSIYVADFYNRIIGHYEVAKDNPLRDRTSGRIWKITYKGNNKANEKINPKDWSKASLDELIKSLNYPQLNMRMMISYLISDVFKEKAVAPIKQMMESASTDNNSFVQGLWILYRLKALPDDILEKALTYKDPMVQVHALRVLAEMKKISPKQRELLVQSINGNNPVIQRIAIGVVSHFPEFNYVEPLVDIYNHTDSIDTYLRYTVLLTLRDHLENAGIMHQVATHTWKEDQLKVLAFVMPEVPSGQAADFSFNYLKTHEFKGKQLENNLRYISRYASSSKLDQLIGLTQQRVGADTATEYKLYKAVSEGAQEKGIATARLKQWETRLDKLGLIPAKPASASAATGDLNINQEEREKLIKERIASYDPSSVTVEHGKQVFVKNCTMCHHIGDDPGGSIGPHLSGIGTWGQRALTEKILNPNGHISTAFRVFNITLKDGKKMSGLFRREEGKALVFADFTGQEFIVPKNQIRENVQSKYTLMPDTFRNTISKTDFDALLKYLLTIKEK